MNNYEIHEEAMTLSQSQSAYSLARQVVVLQQKLAEQQQLLNPAPKGKSAHPLGYES